MKEETQPSKNAANDDSLVVYKRHEDKVPIKFYPDVDMNMPLIRKNPKLFDLEPLQPLTEKQIERMERMETKEFTFSGEMYDLIDVKIKRYAQKCIRAQIEPSQFAHYYQETIIGYTRYYAEMAFQPHWRFVDQYVCLKKHFDHPAHELIL